METQTIFVAAPETQIELQFVERASSYTHGDLSLKQYEELLGETHSAVITTPFCGIDRWFDNHYGLTTWTHDGYMDRVLSKLKQRREKYRLYQIPFQHSDADGRVNLDELDKDSVYILFAFEPSGQAIQLMGDCVETEFVMDVPTWNVQWCRTECPAGMEEGTVDQQLAYADTDVRQSQLATKSMISAVEHAQNLDKYVLTTMSLLANFFLLYVGCHCWAKKQNKRNMEEYDENQPLVNKR